MIDLNRLILIYFPRIALVLFILLISIAMIIYPGGTYRDLSTEGYIFSQNFLSDLGRWSSWNQGQNFYSSLLFSFSFMIVGLVFSAFFWTLPSIFNEEDFYFLTKIGSSAGIISGVLIIGVALTPADIKSDQQGRTIVFCQLVVYALLGSQLIVCSRVVAVVHHRG